MRASNPGVSLVFALLGTLACTEPVKEEPVESLTAPVELASLGHVFSLATSTLEQRGFALRAKEWAGMATGAYLAPLLSDGSPIYASNGTRIRASCGVTFISPSYAVTAGHCAGDIDTDYLAAQVEMYRPTAALQEGYQQASALTGSFPDYAHGRLGPDQGYYVDRYSCSVAGFCSDLYGSALRCESAISAEADVGLLYCPDRPGDKYGYLDIAEADDPLAELFMPSKHEVYDVPLEPGTDLFEHYVALAGGQYELNYHYFGEDSQGIEQNQLLPLFSADFPDGTPRHKLEMQSDFNVVTNLWGCHGTSGSGALQANQAGYYELLGTARFGDHELGSYLCDHDPAIDGSAREPENAVGISYGGLLSTQHLATQLAAELAEDCPLVPSGEGAALWSPACPRQALLSDPALAEIALRLQNPTQPSPFDPRKGEVLALAGGEKVEVSGFAFAEGEAVRVGVVFGCPSLPCPELTVDFESNRLMALTLTEPTSLPRILAAPTLVAESKTASVGLSALGQGTLEIYGVSVQAESRSNRFDTLQEREEAALWDLDTANLSENPQPMRFVGDGVEGFAAELLGNERMLLLNQALEAQSRWGLSFDASPNADLKCGLINADGEAEEKASSCTSPVVLDDASSLVPPLAIYIETGSQGVPVTIDNLIVTREASENGGEGSGGSAGADGGGGGGLAGVDTSGAAGQPDALAGSSGAGNAGAGGSGALGGSLGGTNAGGDGGISGAIARSGTAGIELAGGGNEDGGADGGEGGEPISGGAGHDGLSENGGSSGRGGASSHEGGTADGGKITLAGEAGLVESDGGTVPVAGGSDAGKATVGRGGGISSRGGNRSKGSDAVAGSSGSLEESAGAGEAEARRGTKDGCSCSVPTNQEPSSRAAWLGLLLTVGLRRLQHRVRFAKAS